MSYWVIQMCPAGKNGLGRTFHHTVKSGRTAREALTRATPRSATGLLDPGAFSLAAIDGPFDDSAEAMRALQWWHGLLNAGQIRPQRRKTEGEGGDET